MIGIRSAFSIRARGHRPHLEAVYMTAPRFICRNTKKALAERGPSIHDVEVAAQHDVVIPREGGVSSTPRLIGSITSVSGILGHPPSRVTTTEYAFTFSRRIAPEDCIFVCPLRNRGRREDRVLAAPAVSRAICANKTAHEHTGQREHSGLPCAMALRLTSCSSRRTALLPPSPAGHFPPT